MKNNTHVVIREPQEGYYRFSAINDESKQEYSGGESWRGRQDVDRAQAVGRIMTSVTLVLPSETVSIEFL